MRISMPDTHEYEVKHAALKPSTPESAIQWTEKVPTMPGWYCFAGRSYATMRTLGMRSIPVLVEVTKDKNGTLGLYIPGLDHIWSFDELMVAEWAGPMQPPAEYRVSGDKIKPRYRPVDGSSSVAA
jgi:hypothetical protein